MGSTTVRISTESARVLREIARETGQPMQKILDYALEEHRRSLFLKEANTAYAALKTDSRLWEDELAERRAWDTTDNDGQGEDNN